MIVPAAERLQSVEEYYFVKKLEELRRLRAEGRDIINFGIGSPDLAPSENVKEAAKACVDKDDTHGYQPYRGLPELRQKIAAFYQDFYDVSLDPESEVLPLLGSKEGIMHISMAFLNPGDEVLVPNPGYPTYTAVSRLMSAHMRYYDLTAATDWYPDLQALGQEDLSKVKIMWVNYPHMPTGAPPERQKMQEIVDFARQHEILLCHDNPYSLVLNQDDPVSILSLDAAKEVAIELNSLSKSHNMAGWRVGMMCGREDYLRTVLKVKSNMDSGMFLGIQHAAIEALGNSKAWHEERNSIYVRRREWVYKILDHLGFVYDRNHVGMFVWAAPKDPAAIPDIPAYIDKVLYEQGIFFTPGKIFGSNGEGYLRVSLCVPEERIQEAYERLTG